jgi:hypothetical protein
MPFVLMFFHAFLVLLWFEAVPLAENVQKLNPLAIENNPRELRLKFNPSKVSYEFMIVDEVPNNGLLFLSPDKSFACKCR